MKCLSRAPCSSQVLIELRCIVISGQIQKSGFFVFLFLFFFLQRKGMSFPLFSKKQPVMKSGVQERWVSHLEAFCTQL